MLSLVSLNRERFGITDTKFLSAGMYMFLDFKYSKFRD